MNFRILIFATAVAIASTSLVACESDDDNKTAKAQDCMNNLSDSSPTTAAQACMDMVAGIETVAANVIKCSASFFVGGITTSDIVTAMEGYEDATSTEKEATLITALAQSDKDLAATTYGFCQKTGIPGLVYIAAVSRMGTIIEVESGGGSIDAMIDQCEVGGCENAEIGEMVVEISDLYCVGSAKESQICKDVESAIAAGGGDFAAIAIALYGFIDPNSGT